MFTPFTRELIRRGGVLLLLACAAWFFFYRGSILYLIQLQDYEQSYEVKLRRGVIASNTTFEEYIDKQIQTSSFAKREHRIHLVNVTGEEATFLTVAAARAQASSSQQVFFPITAMPVKLLEITLSQGLHHIAVNTPSRKALYFTIYEADTNFLLRNAPVSLRHPLRTYAYAMGVLSFLLYLVIPKIKVPAGAASYARLNSVYLPDMLSFAMWTAGWIFFFAGTASMPQAARLSLVFFFSAFAVLLFVPVSRIAVTWYQFTQHSFAWSGADGIQSIRLEDIISVNPYVKKLPKWIVPLIVLLGRGAPTFTGIGMLTATSSTEIGMDIVTKEGKTIRVMANYLQSSRAFTEQFQALERRIEENV